MPINKLHTWKLFQYFRTFVADESGTLIVTGSLKPGKFNTILKMFGRMDEPNLHSTDTLERLCELEKGDIAVAALTDTECNLIIELDVECTEPFELKDIDGIQTGPSSFEIWCGYDQPRTEAEAWKIIESSGAGEPGTGGLMLSRLILHFDPLPQQDINLNYRVLDALSRVVIKEGSLKWSPERGA